eukprot:gene21026-24987_t
MGIRKQGLSCAEARSIDMVGFLAALGFQPTRGGSLVDFGMLYYQCSLPSLLLLLQNDLSFPRTLIPHLPQVMAPAPKLIVTGQGQLSAPSLIHYLQQRKIAADLARQYCCEVRYRINDRPYFGIGFKNESGGYEIRNTCFKGSSCPKDFTLIKNACDRLCVLEGFMDFLSWLTLFPKGQKQYDFLILNSLAFFEKARPVMETYQKIHLYLDNDTAGKKISSYALCLSPLYSNRDQLYQDFEDLNDFLCQKPIADVRLYHNRFFEKPHARNSRALLCTNNVDRVKEIVMKENHDIKNKWLHLRLSEAEFQRLNKEFSRTTERKLSAYARSILLGKPMIAGHRNLSLDKLIVEFSSLVKTLNGLANNFNQSVHKLHTLDKIPQFQTWLTAHNQDKEALFQSIEIVRDYLKETSVKWLR